jgi:hypothetical protein
MRTIVCIYAGQQSSSTQFAKPSYFTLVKTGLRFDQKLFRNQA